MKTPSRPHPKVSILASLSALSLALACATNPTLVNAGTIPEKTNSNQPASENKGDPSKVIIRSDYKPKEITTLCDAALSDFENQIASIMALPKKKRSLANTLLAFEKMGADFSDRVQPLTFMGYVSTNTELSEEGNECEKKIGKFLASIYTRKDLYEVLKSAPFHADVKASIRRLRSETLQAFEENGMSLNPDQLKQLTSWKQELAELEAQFSKNLNMDQSTVEFSAAELAGVPEDFLKSLDKTANGNYIVTTKGPHYERVIENAVLGETRKKMAFAYENRAGTLNPKVLEQGILLRQKIAALLGYTTWADYRVHRRMAKDASTVLKFLNDLRAKLSDRKNEDLASLAALKKEKEKTDEPLNPWDIRFYSNLMLKEKFNLDSEKVREYFPADHVVSEMFKVYSQLLGVQFVEVQNGSTWDPSVKLYEIRDTEKNSLIGYFFADFFPRKGKYTHAAAFPLISGRQLGKFYSHPVASIVANFSAPENGKPSLMSHDQVSTIFHEFGHIMHMTLTQAPYATLSGSSVDLDFVEAPSQMLENWVYSAEILKKLSAHYQNPAEKLPEAMIQQLVAQRDFMQGYFYSRQIVLALTDMAYNTASGEVDTTQVYRDTYKQVMGFEPIQNSHFQAGWTHAMSGYDAGYYGYLWSDVYAADMFTRFEKEGLLNASTGRLYRKFILEPGKMKDAKVLVKKFLGREPNNQAFLKKLHITPSGASSVTSE